MGVDNVHKCLGRKETLHSPPTEPAWFRRKAVGQCANVCQSDDSLPTLVPKVKGSGRSLVLEMPRAVGAVFTLKLTIIF